MRWLHITFCTVLVSLALLLGACEQRPISDHTTELTNPSPAPSSSVEPTSQRQAAPNETPGPELTMTPTS